MELWKTRIKLWNRGGKMASRWIHITCGYLQGGSYSTVGFCICKIPVRWLLQQNRGCRMGLPGSRDVTRTQSLFFDDLKVYEESNKILRDVNEAIIQARYNTVAFYGVPKCAETVFERGKIVRGDGLKVLEEKVKTMDPDENEIYKFLGIEQADGIKTKKVFEQVKCEFNKRVKMLTNTELNDMMFGACNKHESDTSGNLSN